MTYRNYPLEKKIRFLDAYKKLGSIVAAAKEVNVQVGTSRYWVRMEKQLREAYSSSLSIKNSVKTNNKLSLEEQLECIKEVEQGLSYRKIAYQHNCSKSVVQGWYKRRDSLLALYYTQNDANKVNNDLKNLEPTPCVVGEDKVPRDEVNKDLSKKIKTQAKEIEYLKDKIAFLENLNKIIKERTEPIKKKIVLQQSNDVSNREEKT